MHFEVACIKISLCSGLTVVKLLEILILHINIPNKSNSLQNVVLGISE